MNIKILKVTNQVLLDMQQELKYKNFKVYFNYAYQINSLTSNIKEKNV